MSTDNTSVAPTVTDLAELFDYLNEVRNVMTVLVMALERQNCESDMAMADMLQKHCLWELEKHMGRVEAMAGVSEGSFFGD